MLQEYPRDIPMPVGKIPKGLLESERHNPLVHGLNPIYQVDGSLFAIHEIPGDDPPGVREKFHIFSGNGDSHLNWEGDSLEGTPYYSLKSSLSGICFEYLVN